MNTDLLKLGAPVMKRVISDAKHNLRLSGHLTTLALLEKLEPGLVEEAEKEEQKIRARARRKPVYVDIGSVLFAESVALAEALAKAKARQHQEKTSAPASAKKTSSGSTQKILRQQNLNLGFG
jgi:hypothetical protein